VPRVGNRRVRLTGTRAESRARSKRAGTAAVARSSGSGLPPVQRAVHDLQMSAGNRAVQAALGALQRRNEDSSHPTGRPIEPAVRRRLEASLGADLSRATVHADGEADVLARKLGANAFTTGSDIYFRQGRYDPGSEEGFRLLAHEATHVVQQADSRADGPLTVSDPGDVSEREADRVADRVTDGAGPATVSAQGPTAARSVQRDDDGGGDDGGGGSQPVKDIPFVKFTGDPQVMTTDIKTGSGRDFYATYEILNMGTAPTTVQDQVWSSGIFSGTVISQSHLNLDKPVVGPNGDSHKGYVKIPAYKLFPGDWELSMSIYGASSNQEADHASTTFTILPRDTDGGAGGSSGP
jgi:Domain of unknown function (DUF4157)